MNRLPAIVSASGSISNQTVEQQREMFGAALRRELNRQGKTLLWLSQEMGVEATQVSKWCRGKALPRYDSMIAAAELLMSKYLRMLAARICGRICPCGVWFIDNTNGRHKKYHDRSCQRTFENRARRERLGHKRASFAAFRAKRLRLYQETVHEMCTQWCPNDGHCPDAACPVQLAGLSPYKPVLEGERRPAANVLRSEPVA